MSISKHFGLVVCAGLIVSMSLLGQDMVVCKGGQPILKPVIGGWRSDSLVGWQLLVDI